MPIRAVIFDFNGTLSQDEPVLCRIYRELFAEHGTAISDRDWKTLCTLATYMDGDGYCYPSQAELARAMGCSRQIANERIKSLAAFRFNGQQVLVVVKEGRTEKGEWAKNGYRVLPISRLRGQFYDYHGAKLLPTFHPAYLLRSPERKRDVWDDMKKVRAVLAGEA